MIADGTTKPISEIEIGDLVLAEDPQTGARSAREVTHLWVHQDIIIDLEVDGHNLATTTEDHPFWNATDSQWQRADALDRGDNVLTADGSLVGVNGLIAGTEVWGTAYNLEVADIHTFFVVVGDEQVLVHNNNNTCRWINVGDLPAAERSALNNTLGHIDAGTVPHGNQATRWGSQFRNRSGDLPGPSGNASPYLEYRVAPPPRVSGAGPLRLVVNQQNGATYYTWTLYGDRGSPAFVRIG